MLATCHAFGNPQMCHPDGACLVSVCSVSSGLAAHALQFHSLLVVSTSASIDQAYSQLVKAAQLETNQDLFCVCPDRPVDISALSATAAAKKRRIICGPVDTAEAPALVAVPSSPAPVAQCESRVVPSDLAEFVATLEVDPAIKQTLSRLSEPASSHKIAPLQQAMRALKGMRANNKSNANLVDRLISAVTALLVEVVKASDAAQGEGVKRKDTAGAGAEGEGEPRRVIKVVSAALPINVGGGNGRLYRLVNEY